MTNLTQAIGFIKEAGLDKIRCCLTGAPYATLTDDEIMIALEGDLESEPSASIDRLVDNWELRALTLNSQALPSLRGAKTHALVPMLKRGKNGHVRILTYLLTRLLHPQLGETNTESQKERMLFAVALHDSALTWPMDHIAEYVQYLVAIDSYCAMPHWHKLWAFDSPLSEVGIKRAPVAVQRIFSDPMVLCEDESRVSKLTSYLFTLLLYVSEKDGKAGYSGNRQSQSILYLTAPDVTETKVPHFQKELSQADIDRHARMRQINGSDALRIAHSAIHGKQYQAGAAGFMKIKTPTVKSKPIKEMTAFDKSFNAAFDALFAKKD